LATAHSERSDSFLEEVQTLMRSMREGWQDPAEAAREQAAPEPVEVAARPVRPSNPYMRQGDARKVNYL
jgi:hypothetical protein